MSDLIERAAAIAAVPSGWTGQPHQSNMDYGPNVAAKAITAIRAIAARVSADIDPAPISLAEAARVLCNADDAGETNLPLAAYNSLHKIAGGDACGS